MIAVWPFVHRVDPPGHLFQGHGQLHQLVAVADPLRRDLLRHPGPVGHGLPLLLREPDEGPPDHIGPHGQISVLGGQIHLKGGFPVCRQRLWPAQPVGQTVRRWNVLQLAVLRFAEEGEILRRLPSLLLCDQDLGPAVAGPREHIRPRRDALGQGTEGEGPRPFRYLIFQGKACPEIHDLLFYPYAQGPRELDAVFPRRQGPVGMGPIEGLALVLPALRLEGKPVHGPAQGLHPFPAPGGIPPEQSIGAVEGKGPLSTVFQGIGTAVGVRPGDGEERLLRLGPCRGQLRRSLDQQDVFPAAAAAVPDPVPGAHQQIGIHSGIGGEAAIPQLHRRSLSQLRENAEAQFRGLPGGELQRHLAVCPENGLTQAEPGDALVPVAPVAFAAILIFQMLPGAGGMAPGERALREGRSGFLSAAKGEPGRSAHVFSGFPQGGIVFQQTLAAPVSDRPQQIPVPAQIPVFLQAEAGRSIGQGDLYFLRAASRSLRCRAGIQPLVRIKEGLKGVLSRLGVQLPVPQHQTVPILIPGELLQPEGGGRPGQGSLLLRFGLHGPVHQGQQVAVLQAAAGGAEGVPVPPQADVALRGVGRAAVDGPDSGISAGFR